MHVLSLRALALGAGLLALTAAPAFAQDAAPSPDPAGCTVIGVRAAEPADPCVSALDAGTKATAPFRLDGGAYRVEWAMRQPGHAAASIRLLPADADAPSRWRTIVRQPALGANGDAVDETYLYHVEPGMYFLTVEAPGDWLVRLYPITTATTPAPGDPITVKGTGQSASAPFTLAGGAYAVDWRADNTTALSALSLHSAARPDDEPRELLDFGDGPAMRSGHTRIVDVAPGTYVVSGRMPEGWAVTFTPIAVEQAGQQVMLAPFAGSWGRHGYSLTIQPNGAGDARWRLYQLCGDPGVQPPCDPDLGGGGHAVLQFNSVDGDTAFGGLADVTDPAHPVFLSTSLTLQPDGTALLVTGDDATVRTSPRRQTDGTTLCRPDAWQTTLCGA